MKRYVYRAGVLLLAGLLLVLAEINAMVRQVDPLAVGDTLRTDLSIGTDMADTAREFLISDFKGKLLILDLWHSGCAPCIAAFPKMESLQKLFGDSIAILLVNPVETAEMISERIEKSVVKERYGLDRILGATTLPMVAASEDFKSMLPQFGFPSHIWIDGDGAVRVFGSQANTHPKKIRELLNGHEIRYIHTSFTGTSFDFSSSLFFCENEASSSWKVGSFFAGFDFGYSGYPRHRQDIVDTVKGTIRSTYVNTELLSLYRYAVEELLKEDGGWSKLLVSPHMRTQNQYLDMIALSVKDTSIFTKRFERQRALLTDEHYVRSALCYEQICPSDMPVRERRRWMLEDIARFVAQRYGVSTALRKITVPCFELRYLTDRGALKDIGNLSGAASRLDEFLMDFFADTHLDEIPLIFGEEDYMTANLYQLADLGEVRNFSELTGLLAAYGFELKAAEKELLMLEISHAEE